MQIGCLRVSEDKIVSGSKKWIQPLFPLSWKGMGSWTKETFILVVGVALTGLWAASKEAAQGTHAATLRAGIAVGEKRARWAHGHWQGVEPEATDRHGDRRTQSLRRNDTRSGIST
jgi:hypothetical protein